MKRYTSTCGVNPQTTGWNVFIYTNQFKLHFEPQLNKVKLDVKTMQSNIDNAIRTNQLTESETNYWNERLAAYNIWVRKLERTFLKQKKSPTSNYLQTSNDSDAKIGWYQIKGKKPQYAPESKANWLTLCAIYRYVEKSIRKDRKNFMMRACNKQSRSSCSSPCQYTKLSGCHFNEAGIKPVMALQ